MTYWDESVRSLLRPLKYCCRVNPAVLPETTDPDWEFDYIDIGSVSLSEGITHKERMRFATSPGRARKPVREGDIIVSTVRTYLKAIATIEASDIPQVVSTGFAVLRVNEGTNARFLYRVVQSDPFVEQVVSLSVGVSYPAINPSTLSNIKVPLPDLATQRRIADFLDRKTATIDELIKKKRRLVEVLGEKRSALITAAVTGRLDPASGRIRASAEEDGVRVQLRRVVSVGSRKSPFSDDLRPYVGLEHITSWTGEITDSNDARPESLVAHFEKGDVLFSKLRPYLAKVAAPGFRGVCSTEALVIKPGNRVRTRFLRYSLSAPDFINRVDAATYGVKMPRANWESIGKEAIWVPDLDTQGRIADFLDRKTATIDELIEKTDASVDLWKEYRAALITAAVTGQIDVTTWKGHTDPRPGAIGEAPE